MSIIHSAKINGVITHIFGTEAEISAQCISLGIADPFAADLQIITQEERDSARAAAKTKFFSLPIPVQVAFLTAWNNINAAMDAGAPQAVILGYFDALTVPPELAAQSSAIRADLVVATSA